MKFNREIEKKFVVNNYTYREAYDLLFHSNIPDKLLMTQQSIDTYWLAPGVDFIRFRANTNELTVKVTDKGTVTDRIEENVILNEKEMNNLHRFMNLVHGEPVLKLIKTFSVFEYSYMANGCRIPLHVSLYYVQEDLKKRVFLEVESENLQIVDNFITNYLDKFDLKQVNKSLFKLFYKKNKGCNEKA